MAIVIKITDPWGSSYCPPSAGLCLQYEKGKWTEAPVGGILCFPATKEGLRCAGNFVMPHMSLTGGAFFRTYLCKAEEPIELPPVRIARHYIKTIHPVVHALWSGQSQELWVKAGVSPWPPGTVAYKRVMPVKEVNILYTSWPQLKVLVNEIRMMDTLGKHKTPESRASSGADERR